MTEATSFRLFSEEKIRDTDTELNTGTSKRGKMTLDPGADLGGDTVKPQKYITERRHYNMRLKSHFQGPQF